MRFFALLSASLVVLCQPVAARDGRSLYNLESTWQDAAGEKLALASLAGAPVFLAMFYASCPTACPMTVSFLRRLERKLPAGATARFVLVSLDAAHDTPATLRTFAQLHKLPPQTWTLLTGKDDDARDLAAGLGVRFKAEEGGAIAHTSGVFLLDADGVVRASMDDMNGDPAPLLGALGRMGRPAK